MDHQRHYHLLAACARARCDEVHYRQLRQKAKAIADWTEIPDRAEAEGVAPLLYSHLQAAGVPLPRDVKQRLQALYLRHRQANQIRMSVLSDILAAYNTAAIKAVVLKGAALAHLVYPEPGLRPMRDVDILIEPPAARQAQRILAGLGFYAPLNDLDNTMSAQQHLKAAYLSRQGLTISVEIHHRFFRSNLPGPTIISTLTGKPMAFTLANGITAYSLSHEEMLWHLCQHLAYNASVFNVPRLIWVADIVSYAERYAGEIDWKSIHVCYPLVLNTLSLLHFLVPLTEKLQNQAALPIGTAVQGVGRDFRGWPRSAWAVQRQKGYLQFLGDTLFPSEWWLRLRYGLGSVRPLWWYRWLRHPLDILGWLSQLARERWQAYWTKQRVLENADD